MNFLRNGPIRREKPGLLDSERWIRDLLPIAKPVGDACNSGESPFKFREATRILGTIVMCLAIFSSWAETTVDGEAIADEAKGTNWLSVGRTYSENHYSPLNEINDRNVTRMGLAWFADLPNEGPLQATPLAIDGVLYFSGTDGRAYSIDGRTGRVRWTFDPDLVHHTPWTSTYGSNRGVAYWRGKVYVGTVEGA